MIEPLAQGIQEFGWHTQLLLRGDQSVVMAAMIELLPGAEVFDHMARTPQPAGVKHAAFGLVARLLERGRAWVKLSGPYLDTQIGPPRYADVTRVAREYVKLAPERLVWGSDWPHPTERDAKPDDAVLFDLLPQWVREEPNRRRILVDNPATLYGF
jgi:predicted TIM-barrel fold metal-dependent hydrolase